jgi:hypothetical protein
MGIGTGGGGSLEMVFGLVKVKVNVKDGRPEVGVNGAVLWGDI